MKFRLPHEKLKLLRYLEECDERLLVEIRPWKKPRSLGMNAYHWSQVITPIAQFMGESPEEAHRQLCGSYWGWIEKQVGTLTVRKPRRTTTTNERGERDVLEWEQMQNFIHHCQSVAADIGVPLDDFAEAS